MSEKLAEIAYEAYRSDTGGVSLVSGRAIPAWSELPEPIKKAWGAAATAITGDCIRNFPKVPSADELRAAIREGRITQDEERRLLQVLAEITFRLWYDREERRP